MTEEEKDLVPVGNIRVVEAPNCPMCGYIGTPLYNGLRDRLYGVPGVWSLFRCKSCRSLWLNPRPRDEEIHKCYIEYFTHDEVNQSPVINQQWLNIKDFFLAGRRKATNLYDTMFLLDERRGQLLDIGCGNGSFLGAMRAIGWDVVGIEPDPNAARIARERFGIDVTTGGYNEVDFTSGSFDAITMSHVIEHVTDPLALLHCCFRLLKEGGRLAITTPNVSSLGHRLFRHSWSALDPPRHLMLFTPQSLRAVVESAGFRILVANTGQRTASGTFMMSSDIRTFGRVVNTPLPADKHILRAIKRMGFVFVGHWGSKVFKNIGEEIGILAVKGA